jgi:hypothetical protein
MSVPVLVIPAPELLTVLLLMVLLLSINVPELPIPPPLGAELPLTRRFVKVPVPLTAIPPLR